MKVETIHVSGLSCYYSSVEMEVVVVSSVVEAVVVAAAVAATVVLSSSSYFCAAVATDTVSANLIQKIFFLGGQ